MKVTKKKFQELLNKVKKELEKIDRLKKDNFSCTNDKKKFQFDYHYIYPPSQVTIFLEWKDGQIFGKRTSAWTEGPMMPEFVILDDDYFKKIFS